MTAHASTSGLWKRDEDLRSPGKLTELPALSRGSCGWSFACGRADALQYVFE
jgi:hypothetical protein